MGMGGGGGQQTTTNTPWAGQQPYLAEIMKAASANYHSTAPKYYQGQTVAQLTGAQQTGLNLMQGNVNAEQAAASSGLGASKRMTSGELLNPNSNPYLASSVQAAMNPVMQNYQQTILPSLRSGAVAAGQVGSTRQGIAEGIAASNLSRNLTDMSAQMYSDAYNKGLSAMTQGLALLPQTLQAGNMPGETQFKIGQVYQDMQQQNIQAAIDKWNFQQNLPAMKLAQYANMVNGNYGNTTITTGSAPRKNWLGGALGGASVGAAFGPWGAAIGGGLGLLASLL